MDIYRRPTDISIAAEHIAPPNPPVAPAPDSLRDTQQRFPEGPAHSAAYTDLTHPGEQALHGSTKQTEIVDWYSAAGDPPERASLRETRIVRPGVITPSSRLSLTTIHNRIKRWEDGESVDTPPAAIGRVRPTAAQALSLSSIAIPYANIPLKDLYSFRPEATAATGLSTTQRGALSDVHDAFMKLVEQDSERTGLGDIDPHYQLVVQVGEFEPADHEISWHVDRYRTPALRYVLSLGAAGCTAFGVGAISKADIPHAGVADERVVPGGRWTPETHGIGVVSRFMTDTGLHRTPFGAGLRIFMSASVLIPPIER